MTDAVFPKSAVHELLREYDLERSDEFVTHLLQTEVLSFCLVTALKPAISSCVLHQRKYISVQDLAVAEHTRGPLPLSRVESRDRGYLLSAHRFRECVDKHIEKCADTMRRFEPDLGEIGISKDVVVRLQELVEQYLRGFFEHVVATDASRKFGYRQCTAELAALVGHSHDDKAGSS